MLMRQAFGINYKKAFQEHATILQNTIITITDSSFETAVKMWHINQGLIHLNSIVLKKLNFILVKKN